LRGEMSDWTAINNTNETVCRTQAGNNRTAGDENVVLQCCSV
jgi:hypothetical protein